jgi:hypothetical protein
MFRMIVMLNELSDCSTCLYFLLCTDEASNRSGCLSQRKQDGSLNNNISPVSTLLTYSMAYGTRRFNVANTRAFDYSLSWAESTQFLVLIPISLRCILILSSHLRLGLHKGFFPVGLPVKILKALLPSSILATCPAHLHLLHLITLTILGERYKLWSSLVWCLIHSPFASLLDPNIGLRILFSNTLSLHSSLNVRDPASQPYIQYIVYSPYLKT